MRTSCGYTGTFTPMLAPGLSKAKLTCPKAGVVEQNRMASTASALRMFAPWSCRRVSHARQRLMLGRARGVGYRNDSVDRVGECLPSRRRGDLVRSFIDSYSESRRLPISALHRGADTGYTYPLRGEPWDTRWPILLERH